MGLLMHQENGTSKVKGVLISLDVKMSKADPSLFYYYHNNELQGIIAIHVDDFLWCGNDYFFKKCY